MLPRKTARGEEALSRLSVSTSFYLAVLSAVEPPSCADL